MFVPKPNLVGAFRALKYPRKSFGGLQTQAGRALVSLVGEALGSFELIWVQFRSFIVTSNTQTSCLRVCGVDASLKVGLKSLLGPLSPPSQHRLEFRVGGVWQ